ncbi:MAG: hypothetical protein A3B79_05395 [Deltaproteobacteria bacterium RIFCSPHIGHO2_02_FULL_50_15]|nr:MAG: hypothetical protein A3B79_05395 [Deltaproteobacteria bacterium RIFCSPHIGHO2_02_FULL_50_15]
MVPLSIQTTQLPVTTTMPVLKPIPAKMAVARGLIQKPAPPPINATMSESVTPQMVIALPGHPLIPVFKMSAADAKL